MKNILAEYILNDASDIAKKISFYEIKNKTILITGASGLIGHYLLATLNQASVEGHSPGKVYLIVKSALPDYFHDLATDLEVDILSGDLTDDLFLSGLPSVDYIIHGAGYGQPGKFMVDPVKTLELNSLATLSIIRKLNTNGKFLFISSSEVYSGLNNPPFKEDQIGITNTNHFRSCYIEGKRFGEAVINAYRIKGTNAKSVRLSLAYGPGTKKDDTRVLNNFIKKGLINNCIDLMDNGLAYRTYIYVSDAVELMFKILFEGESDVYNIGGESRVTIGGLAKSVGNLLNVPVNFPDNSDYGMPGAPDDVFVDMTKVETEFGKQNYIPLEIGLAKTISWQKIFYQKV